MKKYEITLRPPGALSDYENNPRDNDEAVKPVMESIRQFGFRSPILIDKGGTIIAGHTRKRAAIQLGMEQVPCMVVDDLTEEQIKALRLADNKSAEFSSWNMDKLADELAELARCADIDLSAFQFPDMSLEELEVSDEDFLQDTEIVKDRGPKKVTCPHCGQEFEL